MPSALPLVSTENKDSGGVDSDLVQDEELRAVMKLTMDGNDTSTLFPTFSDDVVSICESDDGLREELGALKVLEHELHNELEVVNMNDSFSPIYSTDSSMATFSAVNADCSRSTSEKKRARPAFVRRVHFSDDVQEYLFVSEIRSVSEERSEMKAAMDEVVGIVEDMIEEFSYACSCTLSALDRNRMPSSRTDRTARRSLY
jgi:hypothetical protein